MTEPTIDGKRVVGEQHCHIDLRLLADDNDDKEIEAILYTDPAVIKDRFSTSGGAID